MKFLSMLMIVLTLGNVNVSADENPVRHVILVSFDGLKPEAIRDASPAHLPNFYRVIQEGAHTFNARTDADVTVTIPNHTCMLTGRPVKGPDGHGVMINDIVDQTVHELKGERVESVFDVLRRAGLTSAMTASKLKFNIYSESFPIDRHYITDQDDEQTMTFVVDLLSGEDVPAFLFVHLSGPDFTGHRDGWNLDVSSTYMQTVARMDDGLGRLLAAADVLNRRGEPSIIIITSDHGGFERNHGDASDRRNYTIPFLVWGVGVAPKADLYDLNRPARKNPGRGCPGYEQDRQPIRNGDAANLALRLLGLASVPGSSIGAQSLLKVNSTL